MASDSFKDEKPRRKRPKREREFSSDDPSSNSSSSSDDSVQRRRRHRKERRRKKKNHKKRRQRKHETSYSDDDENKSRKKHRSKSRRKHRSRERRHSILDEEVKDNATSVLASKESEAVEESQLPKSSPVQPVSERAKSMVPMSREQYEAQQAMVREVYDEETGRMRLVRGTGEIMERIVSRSDHERINQQATRGDGSSYARRIFSATQGKRC